MSLHYVKILFRNLRRDRTFAILNFLGLSVGLVAFILIILYVRYESSFDGYHQDDEQIYRVIKQEHDNYYYGTDFFAVTQGPLAAALEDDFPEVEQAGRVWYQSDVVLGVDDRKKLEPRVYGIDPAIFSIFSFEVLEGTIAAFAERKNAMVITATTARRLFGDGKALGQTIRYRNEHLFEVVAVIADMPDNSHFQMQVMVDFTGMATIENHNFERWNNSSIYTYLKLTSGADPEELAGKLPAFVERYITAAGDNETSLYLEPLRDIYLRSQANFQLGPTNDIRRLRIYVLIAILILVIACINYVNLSTAKSVKRAKEVGVRKSIGASRRDLIGQFLGESFLHTGLALLFALMLISIVLPSFSQFTGSHLDLNIETYQWLIPFLVGTCLLVTILAGLYPAFVLSAFRPIAVLKGNLLQLQRKVSLRRILVITQFTVSAVLIIGAVVISRQLAYVQEKDVGYAKEQIVIVKLRDERFQGNDLSTLKRELRSLSIADRVASGSSLPNNLSSNSGAQWPGKPAEIDVSLYTAYVDEEYLPLFGMNLADGNHFSPEGEGARGGVILNEKAVEA
ncbi:MAG: FtsX-like permease family protein, partial [Cyanothece sp. SIO1E1]|nr:FtsX-like permease family protein [Cyanothece sp. SIO1E1]